MLNYEEFENIAKLRRLSLVNAEKDYLQEALLFSIYSNVGRELVFKGGTALYKIYKLNRFSEDLDFTLTKKLDIKKIINKIVSDLTLLNINCRVKEIKECRNEINVRLLLNGPLYKGSKQMQCFIPLNISTREKTIEPKKELFISLYREIPNFDIFVMGEEEILAEKIRAILTRQKPRDIYDLWFLLLKKNVLFNIELVNKKLSIYNLKFDFGNFKDKLEKMRGLWQIDLKNLILSELPEFNVIRDEIIGKLKE